MVRRLFRLLVVLSVVAILGVVTVWVASNTDFGRERVRRFVLGVLQRQTHGIVKIEGMHGNLLSGATLVRVSITDSAAHPFFKADSLKLRYVLRSFLASKLLFDDVIVYRPDLVVARLPNGPWNYKVLWPSGPPRAPGDTSRGWGDWVTLTNTTIIDGNVTVRSPWAPRAGISTRVRDSIVKDALGGGSRLYINEAPGGYQKVVTLQKVNARLPLVRWADPAYNSRQARVAALTMDAYPFRPPAAKITALTGTFDFDDDSLWWNGASARLPNSAMKGDGVYKLETGDMRLSLAAAPATFKDFRWLYPHFPLDGGGTLGLLVSWKGSTQDYVVRGGDVRAGSARLAGDIGVTIADTVFFHDANVRFTGVTTRQIEQLSPGFKAPRQGVLSGKAKFDGTFKRLNLDAADITFAATNRGTSRVIASGVVGFTGKEKVVVSARNLRVRLAPLQIDIVKLLFPTLPIGGTLAGSATLNGSGATQLVATNLDITHTDGRNVSRAVGRGSVHTTGRPTMDIELQATQLALAELTKFAPSLLLKNNASGRISAHGPIDALRVDTRLDLPGGGEFALRGTVDFLSKELGYDVVTNMRELDLSWVVMYGPVTSLTGTAIASGRGFKPATMRSDIAVELGSSSVDTIGVDSVSVRAKLANGIANIERARITGSGALIEASGQLGLDSTHAGKLTYAVNIDSLAKFARYIPGASKPDTTIVRPRPMIAAEARRRARADSARMALATEVERAIRNAPPEAARIPSDTPRALPKGLLAGSLKANGTITGSLTRFSLEGQADAQNLIVQGSSAKRLHADYSWVDARTKSSRLTAKVGADTVSAFGFAFDSLAASVNYLAPNGSAEIMIRQGSLRDYRLAGDFTLDNDRNILRLRNVALRFDSTTWTSGPNPSTIRWGAAGVEVVNLELTSGPGRRIFANGLLPTKGTANFDLEVTDFAVENVAELLQSDLPVKGRVSLTAHVEGTAEDPRVRGKIDFVRGTYDDTAVPEVHGTFTYANRQLTTNAAATDTAGKVLARIDGTVPIDLALSGVTGSRLLDLPVSFALKSDSLPLDLIPQFTALVTDVSGRASGDVKVGGTLKKPALAGTVTLTEVQFKVAATGTFMQNVNGTVRMTGDTVYVDSIAGNAGGPVRLSGTVAVGSWREPAFDLSFTARDAQLVNNDQGDVHADANLTLAGKLTSPYVSGQVTVLHGVLYIPEARGKKVIGAGDPSLFSVVDTSLTVNKDIFPAQSAMFKNLRVDVDFVVERNSWVRSRDANVEVFTDGPMQVRVVGDALTLTGAIDADRGEYTFLSKRFQIKRGSALFIGTPDLNPTLQITAEYQVKQSGPSTNIRVLIGGTLEAPRISLESDAQPPLSQSDLLTYLAFGEKSSTLLQFGQSSLNATTGGNLINVASSRLAGIALGVALDEIKGNAARSLGVDVFNISPGDLPLTQNGGGFDQFLKGTEIEAGRYIDPRTFVSFVMTPGSLSCIGSRKRENSSCAPPGVTLTQRTPAGLRFDLSFTPRYLLNEPTLLPQTYRTTSQFGAFVFREWRF